MRQVVVTILLLFVSGFTQQVELDSLVFGVTVDNPWNTDDVATALSSHAIKPTVRVVFDEYESGVNASDYADVLPPIHSSATVMGELLDSYYLPQYPLDRYVSRLNGFIDTVGNNVDIWEIGNEVNGDWTGNPQDVAQKIDTAFQICKENGLKTAVNFYYNEPCYYGKTEYEMFHWITTNLSQRVRNGVDYALFSYYEDDCEDTKLTQDEWQEVFDSMAVLFPHSKIGFGEVGTTKKSKKASTMRDYYSLKITNPQYIGGYFWWYYSEDAVPNTKALWDTLDILSQEWVDNSSAIEANESKIPVNTSLQQAIKRAQTQVEIYDIHGRKILNNVVRLNELNSLHHGTFLYRQITNGKIVTNGIFVKN